MGRCEIRIVMFIQFIRDFSGTAMYGSQKKQIKYRRGQKVFVDNVITTVNNRGISDKECLVIIGKQNLIVPKDILKIT